MNIRLLFLAVIIMLPGLTIAQIEHTVQGKVINAEGKPVAFAVMVLQSRSDSTIIKGENTDSNGDYRIKVSSVANTILKASAAGYETQIQNVNASNTNQVINFILHPGKTLSEVTVSSKKPIYEQKVDRTVFNVENSIAAIGGNALDALKKAPGVMVMNSDISIAGKNSVSVMINGRMQQLSGEDLMQLLRSIPAENLSKIEVITTPPAKYDAEGNSGMINIVTKKTMKEGFKGSATAAFQQNTMSSPEIGTMLNYRKDKLNVFCNANAERFAWQYTNRTTTFYPTQRWESAIDQYSYTKLATVQLGAEYNVSRSSIAGFQFTEAVSSMDNNDKTTSRSVNTSNKIDSMIYATGNTNEFSKGKHTVNINYEWKIDTTGKKLNVDADYYSQATQKNRSYQTQDLMPDGSSRSGTDGRLSANPAIDIRSVKADVEWPLKTMALSFGGKAAFVTNSADNIYKVLNGADFISDTTKTNAFSYAEQTQALYVSGRRSIGKYDIQMGLRGEHTFTKTYSATMGQEHKNEYTQLFPTGYLQYRMDDNHVFSISYARRINRPGYNMLNPFRYYYSSNSYVVGNPDLKPSFTDMLELQFRWKSRYSFKVYTRQTNDYWDRLIQTDSVTEINSLTRANIGVARNCGLNINAQFAITKWWESSNSANAGYDYYRLHYYNSVSVFSGMHVWFETSNSFFLNKRKTVSAEISGYYHSPRQKDYKQWGEMSTVEIGFKAQLLDKNLIIALTTEDLLARAYWIQTNSYNGAIEFSNDNSRGGRISVTYKFGNKNVKGKRDRNTNNEELQRVNGS